MAKSTSTKPSGSSPSTKAAKKDKPAKATESAAPKEKKEAAPAKSLKRKSDAAEAKSSTTKEESSKPSSPKKSKTTPAASSDKPKSSALTVKSSKTADKKQTKKVADKNKIPVSRRKQRDPRPMRPEVEEQLDEEESDGEVEAEEEPVKVVEESKLEDKKGKAPKATVEEASDGEEEEEVHLHGFSTDEDSSDEDSDMEVDGSAFDVAKLPTIAKDDATVKKKLDKAKRNPTGERGVLFLGRIPHGFYEEQMKAYFSQFGEVTRVRLSRNKRTGKSKHYGFIEFDSASVAKIVAETMDNYLLNGHIMQCKVIPKDKVHPQLWVGANRKWRTVPPEQLTRAKHNKKRDEEEQQAATKRLIKRQNQRKRKLEDMGINYDFEEAGYKKLPKTTATESAK